jgi:hypothetical protein
MNPVRLNQATPKMSYAIPLPIKGREAERHR